MDSLSFPFTIEIEGTPIAKVDDSNRGSTHATLGSNAAVFTLQENRLRCGDWVLARDKTEDRSLLPKQVLWFEAGADSDERVQTVTAQKDADEYQIKFANAGLMAKDDMIYAVLMGDGQPNVVVKMQ